MAVLSNLISQLGASPTLAASQKANELRAKGRDIVSFTVGEPDFDTPDHVKSAAVEALEAGHTKYTAVSGILPLREAICAKLKRDQDLEFRPNQVVVTNGGKQALAAACAVLLNPGDEAVVPAPYWTSYPDMVKLFGGKPVIVETTPESGYLMSPEQLAAACSNKTKIIFLNSPSNPTGACYSESELCALGAAICKLPNRDNITIISDEVYEYITYDGFRHVSFATCVPELRKNTLIVNAFSKTYSMTGWRVGYVVGERDIITAIDTHQSQFTSNVCSIAQFAAMRAYEDKGAFPRMMAAEFSKRLDIVCRAIDKISGVKLSPKPRGAFYAFLRIDELIGKSARGRVINSGEDFCNYILEEFDVASVHGEAFGAKAALRISFALSTERLEEGLRRISAAVSELQ